MRTAASSRSFGLLIAILFFLFAGLSYWAHSRAAVYWAAAGALVLAISILVPRILAPLKRMWLRLGNVLHAVVGPVVLGATYLIAIIPVGLIVRMLGKDLLSVRWNASAPSYWRKRSASGPAPQSLRDPF